MSYDRGLKALNLEETDKLPLFGATFDVRLIERVHGVRIPEEWPPERRLLEVYRACDTDLVRYSHYPTRRQETLPGDLRTERAPRLQDSLHGSLQELEPYWPARDAVDADLWRIAWVGCTLGKSSDEAATNLWVVRRPFDTYEELLRHLAEYDPRNYDASTVEQLAERFRASFWWLQDLLGDQAVVEGFFYLHPFTYLLVHVGWPHLARLALEDPDVLDRLIQQWCEVIAKYLTAWSNVGIRVLEAHDDIATENGPAMSPRWFRERMLPHYADLWKPLKEKGVKVLFVSDGDVTQLMDGLAEAGVDGFVIEGDARLPRAAYEAYVHRWAATKPLFLQPNWTLMREGTVEEARDEALWLASLAKRHPGVFHFASLGGTDRPEMREAFYRTWVENRGR